MSQERFEVGQPRAMDQALRTERASALKAATEANPDFKLREIREVTKDGRTADILIVDCSTHEVPNQNSVGIEFTEQLAIAVWDDPGSLPEVRALRCDFPVTPHQNAMPEGHPLSLCLYEDRAVDVLRTWTAQGYLRRIQWWLANAAKGTLHRPDQPAEQLFFESKIELVLPPEFQQYTGAELAELCNHVTLVDMLERGSGGETLIAKVLKPSEGSTDQLQVVLMAVTADPVVHGVLERQPQNLGDLEATLRRRGAPIMEKLLARIQAHVGEGRPKSHASATVLMIHIPILRAADGTLERLDRRAFWLWENPLTLGEAAGALFRGKEAPYHFYVDHLGAARYAEKTGWQEIKLDVLSVHDALTPELARTYSGASNGGPRAVLAGAGALGSEIFRLWRRAGWGSWTVIDPDHMKPHNTSRHAHCAVGIPKAQALARADQALYRLQAPLVRALATNAADVNDSEVRAALASASLVVDATTTVEVPRRLSQLEYVARTASCFITTSARDAVLLAEDQQRETRIDALEAQYYRAVLNQPWGEGHLTTSVAQFRSGTSCRDVSFVMPHSRIVAHAATLAEQVQNLGEQACIRIWCRDPQSGAVQPHPVDVSRPLRVALDAYTLIWDEGTRDKLRALRRAALPSETGGVILGYHDFNEGMIYVVDALPPPADSVGTPGGFQRGIEGLARTLAQVRARSGEQVGYLGEWHSHPDGVGVKPSHDDIKQLLFLGEILSQDGLPGLQLIVGTADEQWLLVQSA